MSQPVSSNHHDDEDTSTSPTTAALIISSTSLLGLIIVIVIYGLCKYKGNKKKVAAAKSWLDSCLHSNGTNSRCLRIVGDSDCVNFYTHRFLCKNWVLFANIFQYWCNSYARTVHWTIKLTSMYIYMHDCLLIIIRWCLPTKHLLYDIICIADL